MTHHGDDAQQLQELHALMSSAGHAATFTSLAAYRSDLLQLLGGAASQAAKELRALLASDGYAITFQTLGSYRDAMLRAITNFITPSAYEH